MNNLGRPNGKILSIYEAHDLLAEHFDDLVISVKIGLEEFQKMPAWLRAKLRPRSYANVLNDLIVAEAISRFSDQEPSIRINDDYDGVLVTFDDKAALRFKKVGRRLRSSNIPTKRQMQIANQLELEGIVPCTLLTVGYVPNKTFTQILNVHIVCWKGDNRLWALTISDALDPGMAFLPAAVPPPSGARPPVRSTKPTKKKKKGG